ncbi:helix-turn-helix domain-containing protein [uncultured Clostridium sp.]|uniref:winged helix-turn-helix transcriptional regulator n=1 Tax=uncultured Clostridium sp. TaxID=59620 RepID=UPI002635F75A|nr:helix-turn-helix domain-containing protein [uncultured Clostridium sp.]
MIDYKGREFYTSKDLALSVIGGKWKISIIWCLFQKTKLRLSEIERMLPDINQRMLIRQLRELEEDNIIKRTVFKVVPPKVEYELTEIGLKLESFIESICDWGEEFKDTIE